MKLTPKQEKFCILFAKYGDGTKAYIEAYNCKNEVTARTNAYKNLQKPIIKAKLKNLTTNSKNNLIASASEVLEYLTKVMRGEEKDQFGLDASLQDRTKAAELLAKRYKVFDKDDFPALRRKSLELDIKKKEMELNTDDAENKIDEFLEALKGGLKNE